MYDTTIGLTKLLNKCSSFSFRRSSSWSTGTNQLLLHVAHEGASARAENLLNGQAGSGEGKAAVKILLGLECAALCTIKVCIHIFKPLVFLACFSFVLAYCM